MSPFLEALEFIKQHPGSGSQDALAKCILSLYNKAHFFSISEVLLPLDQSNRNVVVQMVDEYVKHGETDELLKAGEYVTKNFPRLKELSIAMGDARYDVRERWAREDSDDNSADVTL